MGGGQTRTVKPDLFSTATDRERPSSSAPARAPTFEADLKPRHVLPRDLPGAIKHLDDQELERLVAAALADQTRRGAKRRSPIKRARNARSESVAAPLTTGKLNAVRAAENIAGPNLDWPNSFKKTAIGAKST